MNARIEQALKDLKAGDDDRLRQALDQLTASAFAFARKVCGNHEDAEDIAQETMIQFAQSVGNFSDARGLGVWLYKVAKTRCLMSRRGSKSAPTRALSLDQIVPSRDAAAQLADRPWPVTPEDLVLREELRAQLERAVLSLPEHYRIVLVLRDMEQLDTEEAAEVLGISRATVKMRLHRARAHVRNQLGNYFATTFSARTSS